MAKPKTGIAKKGKSGTKKYGRWKVKDAGRSNPISAFVRGKITAAQYFAQTGQPFRA